MALTKKQKQSAIESYKKLLKGSKNISVVLGKWIPATEYNNIRMKLEETWAVAKVVKKRLFIKSFEKIEGLEMPKVDGILMSICAQWEDEYAGLKAIATMNKLFRKEGKEYKFEYVGWIFENTRKSSEFVSRLATLPTKEESISKLLYLLQYPIQSIAIALDKIREKKENQ